MENLPLEKSPPRARWPRVVKAFRLTFGEQTCRSAVKCADALERGDFGAALEALLGLREAGLLATVDPPPRLDVEAVEEYARLVSAGIARHAAADPSMREFRSLLWGSAEPLSEANARAFLRSPALSFMSRDDLVQLGVPVVGHVARVALAGSEAEVDFTSQGVPAVLVPLPATLEGAARSADFPHAWGYAHGRFVPGSVFHVVQRWARGMGVRSPYSSWSMAQLGAERALVWFLVSGKAPLLPVATSSWDMAGLASGLVTISGMPVPELLADHARWAARRASGRSRVPFSLQRAALAALMNEMSAGGGPPSTAILAAEWARRFGPDFGFSSAESLARACRRELAAPHQGGSVSLTRPSAEPAQPRGRAPSGAGRRSAAGPGAAGDRPSRRRPRG